MVLGEGEAAQGFFGRVEEFVFEYYKKLGQHGKVIAIGECGLDYYRLDKETKLTQVKAFEEQIKLAFELKKPLMIHCREAFKDLIEALDANKKLLINPAGIVHFFTGTKEYAEDLMKFGFSFSFGGVTTYARDYDEVIQYIGLDHIMLETDAPYVAPEPFRGKRNEPSYIPYVAAAIAKIFVADPAMVAQKTVENAQRVLRI